MKTSHLNVLLATKFRSIFLTTNQKLLQLHFSVTTARLTQILHTFHYRWQIYGSSCNAKGLHQTKTFPKSVKKISPILYLSIFRTARKWQLNISKSPFSNTYFHMAVKIFYALYPNSISHFEQRGFAIWKLIDSKQLSYRVSGTILCQ